MDLSLKNKQAVVCGSTQGIGKAIAVELAQLGASVTLVARNEEKLQQVAQELSSDQGQKHDYLIADFSNPDELQQKIEAYVQQKQEVHILINNTGGPAGGPIVNAKTDEFKNAFNSHLICNHILVQALSPLMKNAGYGRIINIISTSVKQPLKGLGVSNTIRAAVANWAKTMSIELAPFGITVNNVLPGATKTVRLESIIENKAKKTDSEIDEVEKEMLAEIPAGRFGVAEEIAAAAAFLATPAAAYINGINVPVDGGRTGCL
ncbi:MAG: SDR family oxidoreductase [Hymenobacteraceae bacterium]|nr:SDR family oxidoreductase [Hymenobacteraceae bacterium]MDX5395253.1 SDR family oxidoreductase [Hymenobacteraceae bacterium]MDX5442500.1 SDR family oxidoreductase [Hymenobacteraceae bacterium]MDX5511291.1 SDR family oxidoreductase [Hymenobacteraceae bacterium]